MIKIESKKVTYSTNKLSVFILIFLDIIIYKNLFSLHKIYYTNLIVFVAGTSIFLKIDVYLCKL